MDRPPSSTPADRSFPATPAITDGSVVFDGTIYTLSAERRNVVDMAPGELADNIGLLPTMVMPESCMPLAHGTFISLRGPHRLITDARFEQRIDRGSQRLLGDQSFVSASNQAARSVALYGTLNEADKARVRAAGPAGIEPPRVDAIAALGWLRAPVHAIEHAFADFWDTHWHRYRLPFGCYGYDRPQGTGPHWEEWLRGQLVSADRSL